jgi:DNA (cytosine-5)-methyltransferase 1
MNHISLFTGYEGFGMGLRLAGIPLKTILYCEIDPYCQKILEQRMDDGYIDEAPIWTDIKSLDGRIFAPVMGEGIITGGFPCQPHSVAGKQLRDADPRDLWPDTWGIIRDVHPRWCLLENVPALLTSDGFSRQPYAARVVGQLGSLGYSVRYGVASAADAGAPHLRRRLWILAHATGE